MFHRLGVPGLRFAPLAVGLCVWAARPVAAQELLTNGSFENGVGLAGWQTFAQTGSAGGFQRATGMTTPGEAFPSAGASNGAFYAVTDSLAPGTDGPGAYALVQSFSRPLFPEGLVISFDLFVNDWNGAGALNSGGALDFTQSVPTQFARVDLLTAAASPFSTAASDIVRNFYLGVDAGSPPGPYTAYNFNVSAFTMPGATYQLRFASVQNQFSLNLGVDNVRVTAVAAIPEPSALSLFALGLPGLFVTGVVRARRASRLTLSRSLLAEKELS